MNDLYSPQEKRCGCSDSPMVVCKVMYQNADGTRDVLFYRQQCQNCGFVRKVERNGIVRPLYWVGYPGSFIFDWMKFRVAKDFKGERNGVSELGRKRKLLTKIIELADKSDRVGDLVFTSEDLRK